VILQASSLKKSCSLCIFFLIVTACLSAQQVLFISSYSESFETVDLQKEGIYDVFDKNGIQLDIEYMDMKRFNTRENEQLFYTHLKYKLQHHSPYNAILLGDDAALQFAEEHQAELFNSIPMVFFCVNDLDRATQAGKNPYITGAVEEFYLKDTINIALKFQPQAVNIIAIYDNSLTGKGDQKQFYALRNDFSGCNLSGINCSELTREEFGRQLESISADSILLFMDSFEDAAGNQYTIPESVNFIVQHTHTPVYRTSIGGIGSGLLGGKMVSYSASGHTAAEMVLSILLLGTEPSEIPVKMKGESSYCFDYKILKKYNISRSKLPKGAILINKKKTFIDTYHALLFPFVLMLLIVLMVLAWVMYDNMRGRRFSQQFRYQAEHDYLTGLPNRCTAMKYLYDTVFKEKNISVLLMDIDDFKEINDADGHTVGDAILIEIGKRLLPFMNDSKSLISRFGGDEFLLIASEAAPAYITNLMEKIKAAFSRPVIIGGHTYTIKISSGLVCSLDNKISADEFIANVNIAMNAAKRAGKNCIAEYNTDMKAALLKKKEIESILRDACNQDGFTVVYQPQVDIATGEIYCYEALARLKGKDIQPSQFIPIAEESDIIRILGRAVTSKVINQMASWRRQGIQLHPVSINFSSRQLQDNGFVLFLKNLLAVNDIPANLIEIEITESIFLGHTSEAMKLFNDFSSIGVSLTLDDFGTGYSSINYLTYIPVKKIKLDKSLIDIYLQNGKESFIRNIISLIHDLGLKITVEGIETERQYRILKEFSCDYIQGYYFSKPVSEKEISNSLYKQQSSGTPL